MVANRIAVEMSGDGIDGGARIIGGALSKTGRPGVAVFGDPDDPNGSFGHLGARYGPLVLELGELLGGQYGMLIYDLNGDKQAGINHDGVSIYDPDGNLQAILDHDGLKVYDSSTGAMKVRAGDLKDGDYGLAAVDLLGRLVKLDTIAFGQKASYDTSADSTSTTAWSGLGGPVVSDVLVGETGRCKVTIGCQMDISATTSGGGAMSLAITGATILSPSNEYTLADYTTGVGSFSRVFRASYTHLFSGLTPGLHTFTAQYRSLFSGSTVSFADRTVIAEPF